MFGALLFLRADTQVYNDAGVDYYFDSPGASSGLLHREARKVGFPLPQTSPRNNRGSDQMRFVVAYLPGCL